jgi:vacuolar-type H+-ATPase subunit I/STV1
MSRGIEYLPIILMVLFVGFIFFGKVQDANFKKEIRKIDSAREALRIQVDSLNTKTRERDLVLSKILKRNLEIIDTLNSIQNTLRKDKREIDKKIEESKEVIDEYWKNN